MILFPTQIILVSFLHLSKFLHALVILPSKTEKASLHCLWLPFHGNLMKWWKERCLEKLRGDIIEKNLKNKSCLSLWIDPKYIITMRQKLCNWTKILQIFFLSVLTASEWAKFLLTCVRWPSSYCLIHFLKTLLWWFLDRFIFMFIWYF